MNHLISVIMPVYNCELTVDEAIESIISQTYTDWELIICNDASIDKSFEIIESYRMRYPSKIFVITNETNLGLNKSLNKCLRQAKGDIIARMDGDDISLPNRFQEEIDFLDAHKEYAIVSTPMIYFDSNGDFKTGSRSGEPEISSFAVGTPFCHAPCMVRREAFDKVGGYSEKKSRTRVEDWDLWIRMYAAGFKGYNLPIPLYKMRDDRNAYKRRKFGNRINEARVSIEAVRKLHLPIWEYIFALRPIIVGVLPGFVYNYLHRKKGS